MPVTFSLVEVTAGMKPAVLFARELARPAPWPCRRAARRGRSTGRDARRIRRPRKCPGRWCACTSSTTMPRLHVEARRLGRAPSWGGCRPPSPRDRPAASCRPSASTPVDAVRAENRLGVGLGIDVDAARRRWPSRADSRRCGSSWRSIRVGIRCTTETFMPLQREARRRFEAEQAAADHHGAAALVARPRASSRRRRDRGKSRRPRDWRREPE